MSAQSVDIHFFMGEIMFILFAETRPCAPSLVMATCLSIIAWPFVGSPTAASAADMAAPHMTTKASAVPAYQWTGCYVGLNGGGGASGTNFHSTVDPGTHLVPGDDTEVANDGTGSANASNFLGGGQAGCNWQTGTLAFGLEGDFDYFRSSPNFYNDTNTLPSTGDSFVIGQSLTTDYLATVRPRIGVAADRNFAYITGGVAFTHVNYVESYSDSLGAAGLGGVPGAGVASGSKVLTGWTAGAGWEYAWTDHWTIRFEYLFAKFGTSSVSGLITDSAGNANTFHGSADLVVQVARAGLNFKF